MSQQAIGVAAIGALIVLIFLRVPVAIALLVVGTVGYAAVDGWSTALVTLGSTPFDLAQAYSFSVVPLFLLMGVVAARTTIAAGLYRAADALFAGARGSLAMATVGACAGFGAICGSSLATASTMTQVCVPEMRRYGYADWITSGVVASGGTLGILIPPSIVLVIYAIIAQESVPALFAAAMIPGLILAALHVVAVAVLARLRPEDIPRSEPVDWAAKGRAVVSMWRMALIFVIAVGGIYMGWFSPTEAAAVGAFVTIVIGVASGELGPRTLFEAMRETAVTTGALFVIVLGALLFAYFMVQTGIPATLGQFITGLGVSPVLVIVFFVVVYLILGCFLDTISILLITVPVFLPIAIDLGYSGVWLGVLLTIAAEIGLITPPVGLNIFVIRAQQPDMPLAAIYSGISPFLVVHLIGIVLLIAFPALALWLPEVLY